jgi:hypothetical protein
MGVGRGYLFGFDIEDYTPKSPSLPLYERGRNELPCFNDEEDP